MPDSINLTELPRAEEAFADVLICSISFESRCSTIAMGVDPKRIGRVLAFRSRRLAQALTPGFRYVKERYGERFKPVAHTGDRPLEFADLARKELERVRQASPQRYLLDITAFTRENLLILLSLLREISRPGDTHVVAYASAAAYAVSGGDWLSRGYGDVRSVLGFPGEMRPSLGEQLIVLVGYEDERAEKLIRTYEPALLTLGHCAGGQDIEERFHPRNVALHTRLLLTRQQVDPFTFACNNPLQARDDILARVSAHSHYNAIVAPMNTKLSTIGAALAAFAQPRIQLCYVPAREYNDAGYSTPGTKCYMYEIPFV